MIRRDYLLHFVEAFAKGLARIIQRREAQDWEGGLREADETLNYDEETRLALTLTLDSFLDHVDYMEHFSPKKMSLVGEVLFHRAEMLYHLGAIEGAAEDYIKSLHLILESLLSTPDFLPQKSSDLARQILAKVPEEIYPENTRSLLKEVRESGLIE